MIERRHFEKLGGADHGWLEAKHHFSFAGYRDQGAHGLGPDPRVERRTRSRPATGFPAHPHADMEIITYVRDGAITHQDSLGNTGRTEAGDVQVMSAGSGVRHSEYNRESTPTQIFQIWIEPATRGGAPSWGARPFPRGERAGRFVTLASGDATETDALPIRADARVLGATLRAGESTTYALDPARYAYLVPAHRHGRGERRADQARDGAAITGEHHLELRALADCEIVLVDGGLNGLALAQPADRRTDGRAVPWATSRLPT